MNHSILRYILSQFMLSHILHVLILITSQCRIGACMCTVLIAQKVNCFTWCLSDWPSPLPYFSLCALNAYFSTIILLSILRDYSLKMYLQQRKPYKGNLTKETTTCNVEHGWIRKASQEIILLQRLIFIIINFFSFCIRILASYFTEIADSVNNNR